MSPMTNRVSEAVERLELDRLKHGAKDGYLMPIDAGDLRLLLEALRLYKAECEASRDALPHHLVSPRGRLTLDLALRSARAAVDAFENGEGK